MWSLDWKRRRRWGSRDQGAVEEARSRLGVLAKESISERRVVRRGPAGRVSRAERKRTEGVEARARSNAVLIILD
jgi:hypothetical protein